MAPVKKQKAKKPSKAVKEEKEGQNPNESVVSGQLQKKINKKQQKAPKDPKGVVFIKNLPHGFFEEQLKKYFEQFGNVSRVRLARSKRTGNSKGYAFVEFDYPEVAEVAAETMDNYLMFKQIVKASYIPPEKQQFNYFRTSVKRIRNKAGKLVWVSSKTASIQRKVKKQNDWSEENYQKRTEKQLEKLKKIGEKYAHLGIDVNQLVVQPKVKASSESIETSSVKQTKRKLATEDTISDKHTDKKLKNKVSLEDLLGNTIPEDSDDDEYVIESDGEKAAIESGESSDEETYGFNKESDIENDAQGASEIESDEEETKPKPIVLLKKSKKAVKKLKDTNVDRFDEMIKRKSHAGGIKKASKKSSKQPNENKKKVALKMAAAKELAKPLTKVKTKLSGPLKSKKSLIKIK